MTRFVGGGVTGNGIARRASTDSRRSLGTCVCNIVMSLSLPELRTFLTVGYGGREAVEDGQVFHSGRGNDGCHSNDRCVPIATDTEVAVCKNSSSLACRRCR